MAAPSGPTTDHHATPLSWERTLTRLRLRRFFALNEETRPTGTTIQTSALRRIGSVLGNELTDGERTTTAMTTDHKGPLPRPDMSRRAFLKRTAGTAALVAAA